MDEMSHYEDVLHAAWELTLNLQETVSRSSSDKAGSFIHMVPDGKIQTPWQKAKTQTIETTSVFQF